MREARRKTIDPTAQEYLLKARGEEIKLSWDYYQCLKPQDNDQSLGLSCYDCLQGPCNLNPTEGNRTTCGLTKDDLAYRGIYRFISKYCEPNWETDGLTCGCEDYSGLLNIAQTQLSKLRNKTGLIEERSLQVGLGVLKEDYVNVCLEGVSAAAIQDALKLKEELKIEAVKQGAQGFQVALIGDIFPAEGVPSACNMGGAETAILTGLVDLYVVGNEGLGSGRNVTPYYQTVVGESGSGTCQHKLKKWFIEAAKAYTQRQPEKVRASQQERVITAYSMNVDKIKAHLLQGEIGGICILGGGNNIKATHDKLISEAAVRIGSKDILCLTYGNSAITLGKYGFLEPMGGGHCIGQKGALAYCIGSEREAASLMDLIQYVGSKEKIIALFPELGTPWDLLTALAFAGAGAVVLTTSRLPLDGSEKIAMEMDQIISYCEPSEFTDRALALLGRS